MRAWSVRTLQHDDALRLLAFELDNRRWFEQHVVARAATFYTRVGVREHIQQFLDAHACGTLHPCVIVTPDGTLIGRANLKEIDAVTGSAEVGYRVAQEHAGHGVASAALRHMVDLARGKWGLAQLVAYVSSANIASARVLERGGFRRGAGLQNLATIAGVTVDGYQFSLDLSMLKQID